MTYTGFNCKHSKDHLWRHIVRREVGRGEVAIIEFGESKIRQLHERVLQKIVDKWLNVFKSTLHTVAAEKILHPI